MSTTQEQQTTILVVEDEITLQSMVERWLTRNGYEVFTAGNTRDAERVLEMVDPQLMLLDIRLPEESGIDFLERIRDSHQDLGVIITSAVDETAIAVRAMKLGAYDYIVKPFSLQTCLMTIRGAEERYWLKRRYREHHEELEQTVRDRTRQVEMVQDTTVFLMAKLAHTRDDETGLHLERMRFYTHTLGRVLIDRGYREVDDEFLRSLFRASPLHDIGKVGIPDAILLKPDRLTDDEFKLMKTHTTIGAECIEEAIKQVSEKTAQFLVMAFEVARFHHENWDGTGYPDGLDEKQIPLSARILSIADFYDALAFPRIYRPTRVPHDEIIDLINDLSGKKFDPELVEAFQEVHEEFKSIASRLKD